MKRKVLKVRTKLLKQLAENNKFFSQIQIINEDFTDIDFNDVDDTFLFSYGNIKVKNDLTISHIMFWYMNNRDNFKRIYETLIENYNPLQDKNTNHTRTYERKQAKLNTNTFLNGERQTENIKATQTNDNYATTFHILCHEQRSAEVLGICTNLTSIHKYVSTDISILLGSTVCKEA